MSVEINKIIDEYNLRELLNLAVKIHKPIFKVTIGHMYEFNLKLYQVDIDEIGKKSGEIHLIKTSERLKNKLFDYWYLDENTNESLKRIEFIIDEDCCSFHYVTIRNINTCA